MDPKRLSTTSSCKFSLLITGPDPGIDAQVLEVRHGKELKGNYPMGNISWTRRYILILKRSREKFKI